MKPMSPLKGMKPMEPLSFGDAWWPSDLGAPSSSGSQNGTRYAFFPKARRLVVDQGGTHATYDSGAHRIDGISQQQDGQGRALAFRTQDGPVALDTLRQVG